MTTTVRVSDETHVRLAALSAATGRRMQAIIDDAIAAYDANQFWQAFTDGYDEIADDPQRRAEAQDEREREAPALTDDVD